MKAPPKGRRGESKITVHNNPTSNPLCGLLVPWEEGQRGGRWGVGRGRGGWSGHMGGCREYYTFVTCLMEWWPLFTLFTLASKVSPAPFLIKCISLADPWAGYAPSPTPAVCDWWIFGWVKSDWCFLCRCGRGVFSKLAWTENSCLMECYIYVRHFVFLLFVAVFQYRGFTNATTASDVILFTN